jgi:hypothetical protein
MIKRSRRIFESPIPGYDRLLYPGTLGIRESMNIIRMKEASCIISISMQKRDFDRMGTDVLSALELANRVIKAPRAFANFDDDPEMLHFGFSDYPPEKNEAAIKEITTIADDIKFRLRLRR